jgi:hypothetical protein
VALNYLSVARALPIAPRAGIAGVSTAAWVLLAVWLSLAVIAGFARLRLAPSAARALRSRKPLALWRLACLLSLGLAPAALGLALTALAVVAESASLLKSETAKDIMIPVIVGIAGAALYDRIIHARDLYWERIDSSLDAVLNKVPHRSALSTVPTCTDASTTRCQRLVFNSTHSGLATQRPRHRKMALQHILDASVCSQASTS